jgi:hypothetical protein
LRCVEVVGGAKCKFSFVPASSSPHTNRNNKVSTARCSARATNSEQVTRIVDEKNELLQERAQNIIISPFIKYLKST